MLIIVNESIHRQSDDVIVTGGGGGGAEWESLLTCLEKGGKEKSEKKENLKGKRWKLNGRGKSMKMRREDLFLFFLFFSFFACHFLKPQNLFGVYQNGQFYWEKSYFMLGKLTLSHLKNIPLMPLTVATGSSWFKLLLLCASALLVLCCDRFDRGSRQVKHEPGRPGNRGS